MTFEDATLRAGPACGPRDRLADAAPRLLGSDREFLPVVASDGSERLIGLLTREDVRSATHRFGEELPAVEVRTVMSAAVPCCRVSDSLRDVVILGRRAGAERMPVLDRAGRLIGLVRLDAPEAVPA